MKPGFFAKIALLIITGTCLAFAGAWADNSPADSNGAGGEPGALSFTMEESIERALDVNPRIRAAEWEIRKADSDIGRQRGDFFPTVSAQSRYQMLDSIDAKGPGEDDTDYLDQQIGTVNFRLSQPLFRGMSIFNAHEKAMLSKTRVKAWKTQVEKELVLEVQLHFLELLKAREDVQSLQDAVHRLETSVEEAEAFHERRMAPYTQVLQAYVDLADARQELSQAKNRVETTRVQLNIFLDFSAYRNIDYAGHLEKGAALSWSLEECLDYALQYRPEIRIAQKGIKMAEKDRKIALGRFSPRLDASVDYHIRDVDYDEEFPEQPGQPSDRDQRNTYWTAGITLQWEFGLGGQQYYEYSKTNQEIELLRQNRRQAENEITAEVQTYYMGLQEADERIDTTSTALDHAREGFSMAENRMAVRMGTIGELLDAQARLSRAEANHNQAVGDYLSSMARLYHAMGRDNRSLGRETPEPMPLQEL